ncbi:MAG TPA: hypothetical protein VJM57_03370 [Thermodesulfobacteriota bacterium]|nr:hypothetical protein [Thermodesulfobacteriota bacterium]
MLPLSHAAAEEAQAQQQAAQPQDMQDMAMEAAHQEVAADAEPGDYLTGQMLYTGQKRFTNGGPPCMSCHNASVGALGGGCLGPDLTMAYADPSKNPLINAVWINNPGTPVMGPVFSNRPVTDEEAANLRAFFEQTCKGEVVPVPTGTFTIVGIGGFIGILIVFNIIWSGRYRNRVKGTAHDALWRNYGGKGGR